MPSRPTCRAHNATSIPPVAKISPISARNSRPTATSCHNDQLSWLGSTRNDPCAPRPWVMAARPRTLGLSVTPVAVGTALAWAMERRVRWLAALAARIGGVSMQIGTYLHNDAADPERGGDGPDRVRPPRATASGLLTTAAVKRAAAICFAAAALMGLYLVFVGGWPILVLGLLSILSGWAYAGGPLPIAYTPLGELFVVAFFGVGAVCGMEASAVLPLAG